MTQSASFALDLSVECLPVVEKPQESGKVVISDRIQICATCLHQTLPVNSQVLPVLRHMWLYCCPLRQSSSVSCWQVSLHILHGKKRGKKERRRKRLRPSIGLRPLIDSEETPSVTFSSRDLLQAKTIKANGLQMFASANFKRPHVLIHP